ncbi:MAG: beta-galactosidase [Rikenellaceae bacterium]|nr:beta-galactosidase [Rikenellaceae bacterium]
MKRLLMFCLLLGLFVTASARDIYQLNDGWEFFFKSENTSDNARIVTLPHSWNTDPLAGQNFRETTGNYLREIYIPNEWASKRIFIKFYGAQTVTDLFLNGAHIGEHKGGGTAFAFELTNWIRFGMDNSLQVVVSNTFRSDVLPVSTDQNLYGGLYRDVELIVTDETAISPLYYGSEGVLCRPSRVTKERVEGEMEVHMLTNRNTDATLYLEIFNERGKTIYTRSQRIMGQHKSIRIPFFFDQPQLWSPETPHLYTATVRLSNDSYHDEVQIRTGFRAVERNSDSGWIAINGEARQLKGVTLHHDHALGGLMDNMQLEADLQQVQELGATAIRSSMQPHGQHLYNLCDEQGMLVWIDIPMHRAPFIGDMAYYTTPAFEHNAREQLREIIAQNINHPSVIMWGIFSRLVPRGEDILQCIRNLNTEAKRLDPKRLTVACSDQDGPINFITDLIAWRQDVGWQRGSTSDLQLWRDQLKANWGHLGSAVTYGGEGFLGMTARTTQQQRTNLPTEERQTRFHEEYSRQLEADSLFWGMWVENMFEYGSARRPYGLNANGLITLDRREKKDAYYLYRALWNKRAKTVHLANRRDRIRSLSEQSFTVYSSEKDPVLMINDDTVRLWNTSPCIYRSDTVQLRGQVQVRVSAGGVGDGVTMQIGNALRLQPRQAPR